MTRFVLVRHGQTEWNRVERFRGRADLDLDEVGTRQGEAAAERVARWQTSALYSSPLRRAMRTAEIISRRLDLPVMPLDGLIDITLAPLSIGAAIVEILFGGQRRGRFFYAILRLGEKADLWLNLYSASRKADTDGLFGGSKAGSESLLGEIEQRVRGGDEPRKLRKRGH